ncbi:MAG TPA: DUF3604 domain-containing protein [Armatimonadota bacterium]|nr:DUF3604 domain-containing protein [Armatimonadota bacterium]
MYHVQVVPDRFRVYERTDVSVRIASDEPLTEAAEIEVQFPMSWTMDRCASFTKQYQADDSAAPEFLKVTAPRTEARLEWRVEPRDFDTGEPETRHGRRVFITLVEGEVPAGEPVIVEWRNTLASRRAETEIVHVAVNGERIEPMPEIITDPGDEVRLRVIAPSSVRPGEEFEVRIVSLDAYDNASATWHRGDRLLGPDGEPISGPLYFQGVCLVPVALAEVGVHRLSYRGKVSNPIRVTENPRGPYWGDTHIHTRWSQDGIGRFPYEYAREVSGLDFAAVCDHAESAVLAWDHLVTLANLHNRPGEFVTLVAYENGLGAPSGHYNAYYRGDLGQCRLKPEFGGDIEKLNAMLDPEQAMTIPHHTGIFWGHSASGPTVDWAKLDERHSPVVEIYSHHGQSERYQPDHVNAYEFNRWHKPGERTNRSVPGHFSQDAWRMGKRLGVICSSDDHYGQGGLDFEGIAGVFAEGLTRQEIWDGIRARSCYGTTGERILLDLRVSGAEMGQEISGSPGDELTIEVEVHGTDALSRIELVRLDLDSGEYLTALDERPYELDFAATVTERFAGPVMYYVRVQQEKMINHRGVFAWSSPVWVDAR